MGREFALKSAYHQEARLDGVGFAIQVFQMWDRGCVEGVVSPGLGIHSEKIPSMGTSNLHIDVPNRRALCRVLSREERYVLAKSGVSHP